MKFHRIVLQRIGAAVSEMPVCSIWLGHAEAAATANRLLKEREPVAGFTSFRS
jgi:hypothetical protein